MRIPCTICLLALILAWTHFRAPHRSDEILVSAAASLTDAFNEIGNAYTHANPRTIVRFNFGSSGALQQQIEQGAPVDAFASAAPQEMDALQREGRIEDTSRVDIAANRLALIVPASSRLSQWEELRSPRVRRLAIATPDSVPSGRYGRETLKRRRLWQAVQPKCIFGENVRQTLMYVANGDADAGIVFATDARIEKRKVRVIQQAVPGRDHSPIVYPAAVVRRAPNAPAARRFVRFLREPVALRILAKYGFARPPRQM